MKTVPDALDPSAYDRLKEHSVWSLQQVPPAHSHFGSLQGSLSHDDDLLLSYGGFRCFPHLLSQFEHGKYVTLRPGVALLGGWAVEGAAGGGGGGGGGGGTPGAAHWSRRDAHVDPVSMTGWNFCGGVPTWYSVKK